MLQGRASTKVAPGSGGWSTTWGALLPTPPLPGATLILALRRLLLSSSKVAPGSGGWSTTGGALLPSTVVSAYYRAWEKRAPGGFPPPTAWGDLDSRVR